MLGLSQTNEGTADNEVGGDWVEGQLNGLHDDHS